MLDAELGRVASERAQRVTLLERLRDHQPADAPGSSEDDDFHGVPPAARIERRG
jgi:hypothetical protein